MYERSVLSAVRPKNSTQRNTPKPALAFLSSKNSLPNLINCVFLKNMNKKINWLSERTKLSAVKPSVLILIGTVVATAQTSSKSAPPAEDYTTIYLIGAVLAVALVGLVFMLSKSKKQAKTAESEAKAKAAESANYDLNDVDAEKEMEWLRKNQKLVGKKDLQTGKKKKRDKTARVNANLSKISENLHEITSSIKENNKEEVVSETVYGESEVYLPIFSIRRLENSRAYDDLPLSNDESLMDAIEQTQDEMEEDSEVRELSIRILAAFKTRNSVEALSQVALYDLSSNLRSKAVTTLCEFDHESVFEPILLACADPTREVRAAAARGLTKLTFDRADAWTRIAELDAEGRIVAAARAAIESGFVDMSFDRLIHRDRKYAYEAFALMSLLIKAGETEKIFNALENHQDMNVRRAILHTIKINKDQKAIEGLYALLEKGSLPIEFQEEVDKTIEEIGYVTA